jgi:plastocyanin
MKKLIAAGAATAVAVGAFAIPAFAAGTKQVQVKDNVFVANSITVSKGTTVKWTWKGKAPHNVTVTKGPVKFKSTTQVKGTFAKKLTKAGTYTILCTIHAPGMKMTIHVK